MEFILTALTALGCYLVGSIPTAVIAARLAGAPDPRTVGTRNAGSTNVALTAGPLAGVGVLVVDLAKGVGCALVGRAIAGELAADLCAAAAVTGQILPVFAGFRGGKGAATTLGGYLGLAPALALFGLAVWGSGLVVLRRFVVSTVSAITALAVVALLSGAHPLYALAALGLTLYAHRRDLAAFRRGELPTIRTALRDNRPR